MNYISVSVVSKRIQYIVIKIQHVQLFLKSDNAKDALLSSGVRV